MILLVDDNAFVTQVVGEVLKAVGHDVLVANNGKEAVETLKKNQDRIDVVILDMVMPDMDGETTFQQLRAIDPNIKVLLSSGYNMDEQVKKILRFYIC